MRTRLAISLVSAVVLWPLLALAGERINVDESGAALKGFDPVAYFTMGRAVEGTTQYTHRWQDALAVRQSAPSRSLRRGP